MGDKRRDIWTVEDLTAEGREWMRQRALHWSNSILCDILEAWGERSRRFGFIDLDETPAECQLLWRVFDELRPMMSGTGVGDWDKYEGDE